MTNSITKVITLNDLTSALEELGCKYMNDKAEICIEYKVNATAEPKLFELLEPLYKNKKSSVRYGMRVIPAEVNKKLLTLSICINDVVEGHCQQIQKYREAVREIEEILDNYHHDITVNTETGIYEILTDLKTELMGIEV